MSIEVSLLLGERPRGSTFTFLVPLGRSAVGGIPTEGWELAAAKRDGEGQNAPCPVGRRRSRGRGDRRERAEPRRFRGCWRSARRRGESRHRRFPGGGFRRGRFVY